MRWLLSAALAVALSIAILGTASSAGPDTEKSARSQALTASPASSFARPTDRYSSGSQARAAAEQLQRSLPLPEGGNLEGVRVEDAEDLTDADLAFVGQYNAACQWLRAARDGREPETARAVLDDVPRWPAVRDQPAADVIAAAADELARGGGPQADAVLADCDAIHAREIMYARSRGRTPSS